jgi:hypothetical protein
MARVLFLVLAMVIAIGPWRGTVGAELAGCPTPRVVADAMRAMDLPHAAWRALTPEKLRSDWRQLLNQVGCPDLSQGTYLLSTFGRIINDESLCSTTFVIEYDTKANQHWLSKVMVHHTSTVFHEARSAANLFYAVWRPAANVDAEEYGQDEWDRAAKQPRRARTVTRWPAIVGGCNTTLRDREGSLRGRVRLDDEDLAVPGFRVSDPVNPQVP